MQSLEKILSFASLIALVGTGVLAASTAEAQQYCQKRWSPSTGDTYDCSYYPTPNAAPPRCRWTWSAERGSYQLCE